MHQQLLLHMPFIKNLGYNLIMKSKIFGFNFWISIISRCYIVNNINSWIYRAKIKISDFGLFKDQISRCYIVNNINSWIYRAKIKISDFGLFKDQISRCYIVNNIVVSYFWIYVDYCYFLSLCLYSCFL